MHRALGFLLLLACVALLILFFSSSFAPYLFLPLAAVLAITTFFSPPVGLALWVLSSVTTLQIPIVLEWPYFSGPEPGFLAFTAAVAARSLWASRGSSGLDSPLRLPAVLFIPLLIYGLSVVASAFQVWLTLWDLPDSWTGILTLDALSKIFFWRWRNPFHFLRMTLLYLEGLAAFLAVLYLYRNSGRRMLDWAVGSFVLAGIFLMGYSLVEIFLRGKEVGIYPGFGPVFTDRNAFAGFWCLYAPLLLVLALNAPHRLAQVAGFLLYGAASLLCLLSFSFTGWVSLPAGTLLALWLARPNGLPPKSSPRRRWVVLAGGSLVLLLVLSHEVWMGRLQETEFFQQSRIGRVLREGFVEGGLVERIPLWKIAGTAFLDHPLLGIGPGEFYARFPLYKERAGPLPGELLYEAENAHSYLLQLVTALGLAGGLSFFWIFAVPAWRTVKDTSAQPGSSGKIPAGVLARGCLAGLATLLLFSVAQHPMLRFEFHIYFWLFAGLLAAPLQPEKEELSPPRRLSRGAVYSFGIVLAAALLQGLFFPLPPQTSLEYGIQGWEELDGVRSQPTEEVAFIRRPTADAAVQLQLRNAPQVPFQRVQVDLNGKKRELLLKDGEWVRIEEELTGASRLELGLRSVPAAPVPFLNSWGRGAQLHWETLQAEGSAADPVLPDTAGPH